MDSSKALREAAKVGDVDRLRELLANCSPDDVNTGEPKHGYRPLHYAWNGMTVSAGLLIEAQADVNAADSYGRTPLLFSARMGLTPMAEKLVSLGADMNACNQLGSRALHYAAMEGHTATCQKLLKLGADIAAINEAGSTALMLAEKRDHLKTIEYLKHAHRKRGGLT